MNPVNKEITADLWNKIRTIGAYETEFTWFGALEGKIVGFNAMMNAPIPKEVFDDRNSYHELCKQIACINNTVQISQESTPKFQEFSKDDICRIAASKGIQIFEWNLRSNRYELLIEPEKKLSATIFKSFYLPEVTLSADNVVLVESEDIENTVNWPYNDKHSSSSGIIKCFNILFRRKK